LPIAHVVQKGDPGLEPAENLTSVGFYGYDFVNAVQPAAQRIAGAVVFGSWVRDPSQYGVIDFAQDGSVR
jgi:dTDP-glucose pyrophosphorylase